MEVFQLKKHLRSIKAGFDEILRNIQAEASASVSYKKCVFKMELLRVKSCLAQL